MTYTKYEGAHTSRPSASQSCTTLAPGTRYHRLSKQRKQALKIEGLAIESLEKCQDRLFKQNDTNFREGTVPQ